MLGLEAGLLNLPEDPLLPRGKFNVGHILFPVLLIYLNKKSRAGMKEMPGVGTKWKWEKKKNTCRPWILESELSLGCSYCSSVALSRGQKQEHQCICMQDCVSTVHPIQALSVSPNVKVKR